MKNSESPVYPAEIKNGECIFKYLGLTKREYFAGLAMQGLCADTNCKSSMIPEIAVELADELLKQLEQ